MNEESQNRKIDPELEVRIVALVMGEVSAFESDRLLELMESNPELAALKAQIESTHGLMRDVAIGEFPGNDNQWKLSDERRQKLLSILDGSMAEQPPAAMVTLAMQNIDSLKPDSKWNIKAIAAFVSAIAVMGLIAMFIATASFSSLRMASFSTNRRQVDFSDVESAVPAMPRWNLLSDGRSERFERGDESDYVIAGINPPTGVDGFGFHSSSESEVARRFGKPVHPPGSNAEKDSPPTPAPVTLQLGKSTAPRRDRSSATADGFEYPVSGGMAGATSGGDEKQGNKTANGVAIPPRSAPPISLPGEPLSRWSDNKVPEVLADSKKLKKSDSEESISDFSSLGLLENQHKRLSLAKDQDSLMRSAAASLDEYEAKTDAFSTFSLHVSDVSFKLAMSALAQGEWPEATKIRIEEFVNAFDYGDPLPSHQERVACRVEQSIHPFMQQRNLLRVSMRTAAAGRTASTPLRLTLLLDNSGSMERFDRRQTVRRAFSLLSSQLQASDQVTLISFARQPRLLADRVNGVQASQLVEMVENLPSEGGTNIESALQLAFEKAREQQTNGAQNRIVLLTDGAVNLGDANPESLSTLIATIRDAGIAFDAAGISAEGLNDEVLEALARQGDGRYYLLDSLEACDDGFARQIAGALRPSAKNVKVQVEFNPKRVGRYKLLGFEKHLLKQEDFRDDQVDAAEMAAAEAGVAVYQFEAKPDGEGDVGLVSVRFRDLETGEMVENRWPIPYSADPPRPSQATPAMRIATCASLFAAKLRGDAIGEAVEFNALAELIGSLPQENLNTTRVLQLQQMIEQARQMK